MENLLSNVLDSAELSDPLSQMINAGSQQVGGIYRFDYFSAIVLTDDKSKERAGGVPLGGFLLAAAGKKRGDVFALDDDEVILLRVKGTAPLPNEGNLTETRLAVVRDALSTGQDYNSVSDVLTRYELQQSAFECEVLGTFYTYPGESTISFGSDIDNVVSSARYHVFLPSVSVLSQICSFREGYGETEEVDLGHVRFSSTQRKAAIANLQEAKVFVAIDDFVSRKSAVFGMTRTGKSNTIKTLVTSIYKFGHQRGNRIGQLLLDPQGEYANVNDQDGTGLSLLGDNATEVKVYKHSVDGSDGRESPLRINFLDAEAVHVVWEMVQHEISIGKSSGAQYMSGFRSISLLASDAKDIGEKVHFERNRMAFYALLHRANVRGKLQNVFLTLAGKVIEAIQEEKERPQSLAFAPKGVFLNSTEAASWMLAWLQSKVPAQEKEKDWKSLAADLSSGELSYILKAMEGYAGDTAINNIKSFHDASSSGDVGEKIWEDMCNGLLVIVDLSRGSSSVTKTMAERIVTHLMNRARDRFADGKKPIQFQVVVEEAHNLFERGRAEVESDPWVRLSKEAAKYKIGMIYATQEVTGVDRRVLANTSNWLVAHLNSSNETKELSHYYDYATWAQSIQKCEDPGFVRMKTHSSKFIVPIQVAKFDHQMINDARSSAGLHPIAEPSTRT